jgi:hypothetical protein
VDPPEAVSPAELPLQMVGEEGVMLMEGVLTVTVTVPTALHPVALVDVMV